MSDTLQRLPPPSISSDGQIQAAADGSGVQLDSVAKAIGNIHIWSRLPELSEDLLDHLGWGLHIDGWEYADSKAKKLWLVENVYDWHRFKGTEYGLALYWRVLLNRELLAASPPTKSFCGASLTNEERQAFEAPHPEIRVYPFRNLGQKCGLVCGGCLGNPGADLARYPNTSDALLRIGQKVELHDPLDGSVTDLHSLLIERENVERIGQEVVEIRKPTTNRGQVCGRVLKGCVIDHQACLRFYTLKLNRAYRNEIERRHTLAIKPSLDPISIYPREIYQPAPAYGVFPTNRWTDVYPDTNRCILNKTCLKPSTAAERVYKSARLFDPARAVPRARRAIKFTGRFCLSGLPAHTASVAVDATARRRGKGMHLGTGITRTNHAYTSSAKKRIDQICNVARLSKRASDKLLLSITNHRVVKASSGVLAGSAKAGDYQMEVF
ncbi:phage tail protein [Dethiosulfatarculus sandiegensis]|uniref:Tail protein n=1 Tax=Dethiosulfatarculus sandiegensis TaxID=1429043 RepID=A0A0D2GJX4_9BACT|nr:phage tail protein [Dethiosulfatarculus sandiegensis]KIX15037.1 hypothetical protein X474_05770 [Dethiosulfatarculus sandiegensis]